MKRPNEITAILKYADPDLQLYIFELEKLNLKLKNQIAKLQVQNISYQNEITALKKMQPKTIVKIPKLTDKGYKNKK